MAANTTDVRRAVERLVGALLDDAERIARHSAARMQELLPSYAKVPADELIPVTLTNTRNLLHAVGDQSVPHAGADDHSQLLGDARLNRGITADEMLQTWRIGLEVVREEAHSVAKRLEVSDAALLEFIEATLQWGEAVMPASTAAHREAEIRELERLAAEQSALRRVAELVARRTSARQVFATVTEELSGLLDINISLRFRKEASSRMCSGPAAPSVGTADRRASESNAGRRPSSDSTAGCRPRDSSRRSSSTLFSRVPRRPSRPRRSPSSGGTIASAVLISRPNDTSRCWAPSWRSLSAGVPRRPLDDPCSRLREVRAALGIRTAMPATRRTRQGAPRAGPRPRP